MCTWQLPETKTYLMIWPNLNLEISQNVETHQDELFANVETLSPSLFPPCLQIWARSATLSPDFDKKSSFYNSSFTVTYFPMHISLHDVATLFDIHSFSSCVCVLSRRTPTRGVKKETSAHLLTLSELYSTHSANKRCLQVREGC